MDLKKRDCILQFNIIPPIFPSYGTEIWLQVNNERMRLVTEHTSGKKLSELLEILYYLHPVAKDDYENCSNLSHYADFSDFLDENGEIKGPDGQIRITPHYGTVLLSEGTFESRWTLTKEFTDSTDFNIQIDIDNKDKGHIDFTIPYKDFCYAVAKGFTDILKVYGFVGYHRSIIEGDINLRHLLFVKAAALDNFEAVTVKHNEMDNEYCTDLQKEIELLLFEM